jgi:hypothetical protein
VRITAMKTYPDEKYKAERKIKKLIREVRDIHTWKKKHQEL